MAELKISLAEVSQTAQQIRSSNESMYEALMAMKKEMDCTSSVWVSDAGEAIRERFQQFASRFETQKETIDTYARYLDNVSEGYDSLETTITSNASGMQA